MEDLKDFMIDSAGIMTFIHYSLKIVKWFWKWIQPEIKKSSKKKPKRKR